MLKHFLIGKVHCYPNLCVVSDLLASHLGFTISHKSTERKHVRDTVDLPQITSWICSPATGLKPVPLAATPDSDPCNWRE
jgi:hypothetical protein